MKLHEFGIWYYPVHGYIDNDEKFCPCMGSYFHLSSLIAANKEFKEVRVLISHNGTMINAFFAKVKVTEPSHLEFRLYEDLIHDSDNFVAPENSFLKALGPVEIIEQDEHCKKYKVNI